MAYAIGTLSAGNQSAYLADKPLFLGRNALAYYNAAPQWRTGGSGTWAETDTTNSTWPTSLTYDRYQHIASRPAGSSASLFYLLLDLDSTAGESIDSVAILGNNFCSYSGNTVTVTIQIADDSTFSSNVRTIATWTCNYSALGSQRLTCWNLGPSGGAYEVYTSLRYARLRIQGSTNFSSATPPEVSELILGRRRQMSAAPDEPWDPYGFESDVIDHRGGTGVDTRYTRVEARRHLRPTWTPSPSDRYSLDDAATVLALYRDTAHGTRPFLWCEAPYSSPFIAQWMLASGGFSLPYVSVLQKSFGLDMMEQAPTVESEVT
ncbi:MAG: hypothetical protein RL139_1568 [Gemmatimonadota bacterium]|jgi:hypothetical protein